MKPYDLLIVGAGLFGAVVAQQARERGLRCLVVERRDHVAGNAFTQEVEGIQVHRYGAHIFHTSDEAVWAYVSRFASFRRYTHSPVANYRGELYNLPFNMNTFSRMWGVRTPREAMEIIERQRAQAGIGEPRNLEEQAVSLVGEDIYRKLVEGYTEKQWGRPCRELPAFIIRRLPVRFTFDNDYFSDAHEGIPEGGYTRMVERMLEGVEVRLGVDYLRERGALRPLAGRVVYTGPIDAYFGYDLGALAYRSLRFDTRVLDEENYQGCAVVNYTDRQTPFTRVIEHKHFAPAGQKKTVVTWEYSAAWQPGDEPYYPVNDAKNNELLARYQEKAAREEGVLFGGRLGEYRYYDMDKVVASALALCSRMLCGSAQ